MALRQLAQTCDISLGVVGKYSNTRSLIYAIRTGSTCPLFRTPETFLFASSCSLNNSLTQFTAKFFWELDLAFNVVNLSIANTDGVVGVVVRASRCSSSMSSMIGRSGGGLLVNGLLLMIG